MCFTFCKTFGLIYSILTAKFIDLSLLIDYSTYFRDVIQYYFRQFSPVSAKKRLLTIEINEI